MLKTVKVVSAGESMGIVLSSDLLEKFGASLGDTLTITENRDGFELRAADMGFPEAISLSEGIIREDRDPIRDFCD